MAERVRGGVTDTRWTIRIIIQGIANAIVTKTGIYRNQTTNQIDMMASSLFPTWFIYISAACLIGLALAVWWIGWKD